MMSTQPLNVSRRTALLVLVAATVAACATTDSGKSMSSAEPDRLVSDAQVTLSTFVRDPDQHRPGQGDPDRSADREGGLHLRRIWWTGGARPARRGWPSPSHCRPLD